MTNPTSANDLLMGAGVPGVKFPEPGTSITGVICAEPEARQQTDFSTGEGLTWPSGDPKMQIVVRLQTQLRDNPDDDGIRALYIKGKSLTTAVRDAVRKTGANGLEVGGTLTVTYTGDGTSEHKGINPPKLYTAAYTPPAAAAINDTLGLSATPQAAGQAPTTAPTVAAPAAAPAAPAAAAPPAQAAVTPEVLAALGNLPPEALEAIKAQIGAKSS